MLFEIIFSYLFLGAGIQKAPASDDLRHPDKFPYPTVEGALTRAYSLLRFYCPAHTVWCEFRQFIQLYS